MHEENPLIQPNNRVHQEEGSGEIPAIFDLIEPGASTTDLVKQLQTEFYHGESERAVLAARALLRKGLEGEAALKYLTRGTDDLSQICSDLTSGSSKPVETFFGISRFGTVIRDWNPDDLQKCDIVLRYGQEKGYAPVNAKPTEIKQVLLEQYEALKKGESAHLTGTIEKWPFTISNSFGVDEPSYLELTGPEEIIRLRQQKAPKFLLLGSLGPYSAYEMDLYAKKINKGAISNVIDISEHLLWTGSVLKDKAKINLTIADALNLPFKNDSMDQICSNYLLHFLMGKDQDKRREKFNQLFKEIARILKPGGSFVMVEMPYAEYLDSFNDKLDPKMIAEVIPTARRYGLDFSIENPKTATLRFMYRGDTSKARISKNGFPHYEGTLMTDAGTLGSRDTFAGKFTKPL